MLDRSKIGHAFPAYTADVEKGRLLFFTKAIGETNPIYTDEAAARDAGHRELPAPPTFAWMLDMEAADFLPVVGLLDLDIARILHGSQEFEYFGQIYAGDNITVNSRITDIFDKKGGALEFMVIKNTYTNQNGDVVGKVTNTLVYRNG